MAGYTMEQLRKMSVAEGEKLVLAKKVSFSDWTRARTTQCLRLYCKVSEKGGVSVYGLQRMPVTLYGSQWERLADFMPTVLAFIADNKGELSVKGE